MFGVSILLPLSALAHKGDPCWFVGWRLAKTPSSCREGICENIVQLIESDVLAPIGLGEEESRPITCIQAQVFMAEFLAFPYGEEGDVNLFSNIVAKIDETVLPDARRSLFRAPSRLLLDSLLAMESIDAKLLQYMRDSSENEWDDFRLKIRMSEAYRNLLHVGQLIREWSISSPTSSDLLPGSLAPFVHFLLDMISLIDQPGSPDFEQFTFVQLLAVFGPIAHRKSSSFEISLRINLFEEQSIGDHLYVALLIDKLDELDQRALTWLVHKLSTLVDRQRSEISSTEAIIRHQLETKACVSLAWLLPGLRGELKNLKAIISVMHLCKPYLPSHVLLKTSQALVSLSHVKIIDLIHEALPEFNIDPLQDHRVLAASVIQSFVIIHRPMRGSYFRPVTDFDSQFEFESTMRMFGRCLAFAVLFAGPSGPQDFKLSQTVAMSIFREVGERVLINEFGIGDLRQLELRVHEPIFFVRKGIQDIVGPMGVQVFAEPVWLASIADLTYPFFFPLLLAGYQSITV